MTSREDAGGRSGQEEQILADAAGRALFARDRASNALGMRLVEVRPGYARVSMTVRADMLNGNDVCHGGIIFSLADSAFAFACNSYNVATVAAAASVDFLYPATGGDELTAEAREQWRSKRNGLYEVNVSDQSGRRIAMFRGRSYRIGGEITAVDDAGER